MKSRNRRSTNRRNRKNRNRTRNRHGSGMLSSRIKTYKDNVALCNKSTIGAKYIPGGCETKAAKEYNFTSKGMFSSVDADKFYPTIRDPLYTVTPKTKRSGPIYAYNGEIIDKTTQIDPKILYYDQIGERLLRKYANGQFVGFVLKDTPLTYQEVSSKTIAELEQFFGSMPKFDEQDVDQLFIQRNIKI